MDGCFDPLLSDRWSAFPPPPAREGEAALGVIGEEVISGGGKNIPPVRPVVTLPDNLRLFQAREGEMSVE